jgi:hypothetical protein
VKVPLHNRQKLARINQRQIQLLVFDLYDRRNFPNMFSPNPFNPSFTLRKP